MDAPRSLVDAAAYREARSMANRKIGFIGHAVVYGCTGVFLTFVAGFFAATIVMLAWGIGLAAHGFFFVAAPMLRKRWMAEEVDRRVHTTVVHERRELEGRHARSIEQLSASIAHEIRNPITAARSLVAQMGRTRRARRTSSTRGWRSRSSSGSSARSRISFASRATKRSCSGRRASRRS